MAGEDVIADLRKGYGHLTLSQKRVAESIIEDPEFVAFATVDKMAARLDVSPSTIVRFAYRIGLSGYPELQDRVRQLVRSQLRSNMWAGGNAAEITSHLADTVYARSLRHDIEILHRSIIGLKADDLERAASAISAARRVYVVGGATTYSVAFFLSLALERIRGDSSVLMTEGHAAPALASLSKEDVLLVFTFPPYASSTLRITASAKAQGSTVIAVTDTVISPVGQQADIVLPVLSSGVSLQNSLVPAMAVANALINGVIEDSPGADERHRRILSVMNDWDAYILKDDVAPADEG